MKSLSQSINQCRTSLAFSPSLSQPPSAPSPSPLSLSFPFFLFLSLFFHCPPPLSLPNINVQIAGKNALKSFRMKSQLALE